MSNIIVDAVEGDQSCFRMDASQFQVLSSLIALLLARYLCCQVSSTQLSACLKLPPPFLD